jgi:hypothetical protein
MSAALMGVVNGPRMISSKQRKTPRFQPLFDKAESRKVDFEIYRIGLRSPRGNADGFAAWLPARAR